MAGQTLSAPTLWACCHLPELFPQDSPGVCLERPGMHRMDQLWPQWGGGGQLRPGHPDRELALQASPSGPPQAIRSQDGTHTLLHWPGLGAALPLLNQGGSTTPTTPLRAPCPFPICLPMWLTLRLCTPRRGVLLLPIRATANKAAGGCV